MMNFTANQTMAVMAEDVNHYKAEDIARILAESKSAARDAVVKFAADLQFNYPILIGQSEAWAGAGAMGVNIYGLPFTVFVASDGNMLGVHTGELHAEHLEAFQTVVDDLASQRIDLDEARHQIADQI